MHVLFLIYFSFVLLFTYGKENQNENTSGTNLTSLNDSIKTELLNVSTNSTLLLKPEFNISQLNSILDNVLCFWVFGFLLEELRQVVQFFIIYIISKFLKSFQFSSYFFIKTLKT